MSTEDEDFIEEEWVDHATLAPTLYIYEAPLATESVATEPVPPGFNAITCPVDLQPQARLDFANVARRANRPTCAQFAPIFDLELGLFQKKAKELTHKIQFQAYAHAIDQFSEFWEKEFSHAPGIVIARLSCNFAHNFHWTYETQDNLDAWLKEHFEERLFPESLSKANEMLAETEEGRWLLNLFCRDCIVQYLQLLTSHLPDHLLRLVLLDARAISSPLMLAELAREDIWTHFVLATKGAPYPLTSMIWEEGTGKGYIGRELARYHPATDPTIGIILPVQKMLSLSLYSALDNALKDLIKSQKPFKVIPEELIARRWDGLDILITPGQAISSDGIRMLHGFAAAGGHILFTDSPLGVPNERRYSLDEILLKQ
jgi:hypothetical protein